MAREKRTAHKSLNSLVDTNCDIPSAQTVDEAQKPKSRLDLEKARSVIHRRQNGQSVTWAELDWAKTVCTEGAKLEEAEKKEATATEMKKQQWQQAQERRIQEINAANRDSTWTARMLLKVLLGEGDKSDSESDSDLSSEISDVTALEPDRVPQKESEECKENSTREPGGNYSSDEEEDRDAEALQAQVSSAIIKEDTHTTNKQPQAPLPPLLGDSNNDVAAEEDVVAEDSGEDIWDDDVWARIINEDEEH